MSRGAVTLALALAWGASAAMETRRAEIVEEFVRKASERWRETQSGSSFSETVHRTAATGLLAAWMLASTAGQVGRNPADEALFELIDGRSDKQLGAGPEGTGTTSLVLRGAAPAVFAMAVESGAVVREVSGTTVTFRGNPMGLVHLSRGFEMRDWLAGHEPPMPRWLRSISVAAAFDTSRGSTPGVLTASGQQLTSWSARSELISRRDPRDAGTLGEWQRLAAEAHAYREAISRLGGALDGWTEFRAWNQRAVERVSRDVDAPLLAGVIGIEGAVERFRAILTAELARLSDSAPPAAVEAEIVRYASGLKRYLIDRAKVHYYASRGALLAVDFTARKGDSGVPGSAVFTAIFEKALGRNRTRDLTMNASASFSGRPGSTASRTRDWAASMQFDTPLGPLEPDQGAMLSLAFRLQSFGSIRSGRIQNSGPGAIHTGNVLRPGGIAAVVQVKLTLPVRGGVRVPLAFTAANRSELIQNKRIAANIGISLDFDSLLAKSLLSR